MSLRFTPTCVGNLSSRVLGITPWLVHPRSRGEIISVIRMLERIRVHPHSRGENDRHFSEKNNDEGLSPLAWGKWV